LNVPVELLHEVGELCSHRNMKCSYQRNLTDVIFDYLSIKLDGVFKLKKIPIPFIYMNKIVIFV
jgi:hypothetical protein